MTTPHPFLWLYREGDHRDNLDKAAGLLRMVCEINLDEMDSDDRMTINFLLRSVADVIDITQQQTAPQA